MSKPKKKKRSAAQHAATRKMIAANNRSRERSAWIRRQEREVMTSQPGKRNRRRVTKRTAAVRKSYKRIGAQPLSKLEEKKFRDFLLTRRHRSY